MSETRRKNSQKRTAIYEALKATCGHPSAEMLHGGLKEFYPDLSLGTVYRNLSEFCEEGKAFVVGNVDGKDRFDARMDEHAHFICRSCGKVIDVDLPVLPKEEQERIGETYRFLVESCAVSFRGLCSECREKFVQNDTESKPCQQNTEEK